MPKVSEIWIINPIDRNGYSHFMAGVNKVVEIRADYVDCPFATIVFEDGSRQFFCGMPHTYKTEKSPVEEPF
jgi:hypothetical protein